MERRWKSCVQGRFRFSSASGPVIALSGPFTRISRCLQSSTTFSPYSRDRDMSAEEGSTQPPAAGSDKALSQSAKPAPAAFTSSFINSELRRT